MISLSQLKKLLKLRKAAFAETEKWKTPKNLREAEDSGWWGRIGEVSFPCIVICNEPSGNRKFVCATNDDTWATEREIAMAKYIVALHNTFSKILKDEKIS